MKYKYEALRSAIRERYMSMEDVAQALGKSLSYVTQRMSGSRQWEMSDVYTLMDLLDIPIYQMPAYFTKDGARPDPTEVRPPLTPKQAEIIAAYEQADEMQPAIDKLLGIIDGEKKTRACTAATVTGSGRKNRFGFCLDYSR